MNDNSKPVGETGQDQDIHKQNLSEPQTSTPLNSVNSENNDVSASELPVKKEAQPEVVNNSPQVSQSSWNVPEISVDSESTDSQNVFGDDRKVDRKESLPVVKVWSIRGVEYAIMSFMLWAIAIAITWVLVAMINGGGGFVQLSAPLSLLIVSLPFFAVFFLRLKKAELMDVSLKTESTKRKFSQITQVISFAVVFFSLLAIVATILSAIGGETEEIGRSISTAIVFAVVWGALFAYYWFDEHRNNG